MDNNGVINHNFYFFVSEGRKWGLDIGAVREVGELTGTLCPIPHAQHSVMGYLNVRGDIYQLISFKSLISGKKEVEGDNGLVLFLKDSVGQAMGIYVDDACEISTVCKDDIEKWDTQKAVSENEKFDMSEYLTSSVYHNCNELIPLIDPFRIESGVSFST